jgi:hypothetical protein
MVPDAVEALRRCVCPAGLQASGARVGHRQIWARDSMIALLGARFAGEEQIDRAVRASLRTLADRRTPSGAVPNNVDAARLRPNFRAYADGGLWWIIGSALVDPDPAAIRQVLTWYECQDVDQSGLLSMQESADWQDLFCTRGKGLYLNCLYVMALRIAAPLFAGDEAARYRIRADHASAQINGWMWYRGDGNMLRHISHTFSTEGEPAHDSLGRARWVPPKRHLVAEQYYLPYLSFRAAGEWFDSLGNVMAVLAGVADRVQTETIFAFISRCGLDEYPMRSLTPPVQPGDSDWRDYYGELNLPECYHNGGIWPFIGGFYIAALVKSGRGREAEAALQRLAVLNQRGHFNEWHHGQTAAPMGVEDQAWSAGMYLFARECVKRGKIAW